MMMMMMMMLIMTTMTMIMFRMVRMVNAIYIFRFFHNAYFQNKRMDQNGTRKVVEQSKMKEMNNFKEEEEKKEKIQ